MAGLAPQVGIYGYLLGGLGYALLGSSRQLAVGPTSAISLMLAGTVGAMAGGDPKHYAEIASLTAFTVALLCLIAWLLRLSILVRLISDSILVGFKAGAGLTIIMTSCRASSASPVAGRISSNEPSNSPPTRSDQFPRSRNWRRCDWHACWVNLLPGDQWR